MKNYLLSIIIVTFNNEEHITGCLTSLTKINITCEIIIIDNNSIDHTLNKIIEFIKKTSPLNISLIQNKINRGFASAVNQGIKKKATVTLYPYWDLIV